MGLLSSAIKLDEQLSVFLHNNFSQIFNSPPLRIVLKSGDQIHFWSVVITLILFFDQTFVEIFWLAVTLVLTTLLLMVIKPLVKRKRPPFKETRKIKHYYDNFSFPSGHATRAGVIMSFLLIFSPSPNFVVVAVWTILIALSRVTNLEHYITDVVGGVVIGVLCTYIFSFPLSLLGFPDRVIFWWII